MHLNRRMYRGFVAACALGVLLAGVSTAQNSGGDRASFPSIENFGRVNDGYYRGGQPRKADYPRLAALGIKTVIDLERSGESDEQALVEHAGMKFHRIPMSARSKPNPESIKLFLSLVTDPANRPVFVHCHGGRHRTGIMTAIYRIETEGWAAERAIDEMKQYEFEKGFGHSGLKEAVLAYQPTTNRKSTEASVGRQ